MTRTRMITASIFLLLSSSEAYAVSNVSLGKDDVSGVGGSFALAVSRAPSDAAGSLIPNGSETDFGLAYNRPLSEHIDSSLNIVYRSDADNISGARDAAAMIKVKWKF